jgi:hypothetical protein
MIRYEQNLEIEYVSNADGTTVISIPSLIGALRIVYMEKEIQPVSKADYSFNSSSGVITLLNGKTVDAGQTLYIIYAILITA